MGATVTQHYVGFSNVHGHRGLRDNSFYSFHSSQGDAAMTIIYVALHFLSFSCYINPQENQDLSVVQNMMA
jgi:hypothetical protein